MVSFLQKVIGSLVPYLEALETMKATRFVLAIATLALVAISAVFFSTSFSGAVTREDYVLHEWGTFTSVSSSDGSLLPGLEREEEALPHFVFSHAGMENIGTRPNKGWRRPLRNVTVKMETPVIYFYSDSGFRAHVEVGFHGGSISQWYPQRTGGEVPPPHPSKNRRKGGEIDFSKGYEGSIA